MRDLDIVLVANCPVEKDVARRIGEELDSPDLRFLPRYLYPRRRTRSEREPEVAGWGVIWDARGVEVDLSIFHDAAALELNGLMNIDRILIPLPPDRSLNAIAAAMLTAESAEAAVAAGLVIDPRGGYASWAHRSLTIVNWNAIHAAPIECSMRIVRACAGKLHMEHLHADIADPLRAAIQDLRRNLVQRPPHPDLDRSDLDADPSLSSTQVAVRVVALESAGHAPLHLFSYRDLWTWLDAPFTPINPATRPPPAQPRVIWTAAHSQ